MKINITSFSELYKWDTCQRQFYYNFTLGLVPVTMSEAINTGIKGHKLLQSFYEGLMNGFSKEEALEATHTKAKKLMESDKNNFDLLFAWTLVEKFIKETTFTANAVLAENRFLFPASALTDDPELEGLQIGFTPDVVFKRNGDFYDVEDAKFVKRAWGVKKMDMFPQAKLYQVFLRRMGYNVSRSIVRFFNTTTGKIEAKPYPLTSVQEKILIEDFVEGIKILKNFKERPIELQAKARRTSNYTQCQYCAFSLPCSLEAEGKNAEKTLNHMYTKSDYDYSV